MAKRREEALIFPTVHEFNGKTKDFMKIVNNPNTVKAYKELLKELKCKPSEVGAKLRERAWKGKAPRDILEELGWDAIERRSIASFDFSLSF